MTIEQIRELCNEQKIVWSVHSVEMMMRRGIERLDVLDCLQNGEIIEDYPNSFPHPGCLVFGVNRKNEILHVVVGLKDGTLVIVTAYYPNTIKFESDLKTRRAR